MSRWKFFFALKQALLLHKKSNLAASMSSLLSINLNYRWGVLAKVFVLAFDSGSEIFIFVVKNHFDQLVEAPRIRDLFPFLDVGGGDAIEEGEDDGFGLLIDRMANFAHFY